MLLRIFSEVYDVITSLRNFAYDRGVLPSYRSSLAVVSIGNMTVGGNGKTPLCMFLVERLQGLGYHPAILLRGYGGSNKQPKFVEAEDSPKRVGDEALMLFQRLGIPVVVGPDRVKAIKMVEASDLADVVILDDGFQHRRLQRDVNIVTVNVGSSESRAAFIQGQLLPAGRFREARDKAFKRVDILVLAKRGLEPADQQLPSELLEVLPVGLKPFNSWIGSATLRRANGDDVEDVHEAVAFCAIANPEPFFDSLRAMGIELSHTFSFPDHHLFTSEDMDRLREQSRGQALICTAKDMVKLMAFDRENICYLDVDTSIDREGAFIEEVVRRLPPKLSTSSQDSLGFSRN